MIRVGTGYDIHRLKVGEELFIGGVSIPSDRGAVGHSDADALIHAVIDALFGAAGLGDIGEHFPPSDPRYLGISSRKLLVRAAELVREAGWEPVNLDTTVVLQEPKLSSHKPAIQETLAADLGLPPESVNVKAKTKEGVDSVGEGFAIEAHAVVLVAGVEEDTADHWV